LAHWAYLSLIRFSPALPRALQRVERSGKLCEESISVWLEKQDLAKRSVAVPGYPCFGRHDLRGRRQMLMQDVRDHPQRLCVGQNGAKGAGEGDRRPQRSLGGVVGRGPAMGSCPNLERLLPVSGELHRGRGAGWDYRLDRDVARSDPPRDLGQSVGGAVP